MYKSPCQHTCPIEMDIPSYIALVRDGRLKTPTRSASDQSLPVRRGRVLRPQVPTKCRRGNMDEPLAIKFLKRFIRTMPRVRKRIRFAVTPRKRSRLSAAGPAGLTAARDLALRGYKVPWFEELSNAGGMLRWVFPRTRLPRNILQGEIDDITRRWAVEIRLNTPRRTRCFVLHSSKGFRLLYSPPRAHTRARNARSREDLATCFRRR